MKMHIEIGQKVRVDGPPWEGYINSVQMREAPLEPLAMIMWKTGGMSVYKWSAFRLGDECWTLKKDAKPKYSVFWYEEHGGWNG